MLIKSAGGGWKANRLGNKRQSPSEARQPSSRLRRRSCFACIQETSEKEIGHDLIKLPIGEKEQLNRHLAPAQPFTTAIP